MEYNSLAHHGIKGQKWGVRRFQNADGTYTEAGKERYYSGDKERKGLSDNAKKAIGAAAVTVGALAIGVAAAKLYKSPKVRSTINKIINNSPVLEMKMSQLKNAALHGKDNFKTGLKEGAKSAPEKLGKIIGIGILMNVGKQATDYVLGKENSDSVFKANDKKQIAKFWPKGKEFIDIAGKTKENIKKIQKKGEDKDDDDEDD